MLLERLDRREVLAADIGAIAGIAFVDEALDGLSQDDPRVEAATVELYLDDGIGSEGAFSDSGGDADTLHGTTSTAGGADPQPGLYRFDDLSPGDYWVVQTATGGLTPPDPALVTVTNDGGVQVELIDDYSGTGQSLTADGVLGDLAEDSVVDGNVIGGHRDVRLERTNATGSITVTVDNSAIPPELILNPSTGAEGDVLIQYDGADGQVTLDAIGLGGVSLAGGAAGEGAVPNSGLRVMTRSVSTGQSIVVSVYTDANNFSQATITIPQDASQFGEVFVPFADFVAAGVGGGADFNNVGAIEATMTLTDDNDAFVSILESLAPEVVTANLPNIQPMELGGELFVDTGTGAGEFNNGLLDAGEGGVPTGTDVDLYQVSGPEASVDVGTDTSIASTTTGVGGVYNFAGLEPGHYVVVVRESNFEAGGNLEGFSTSTGLDPTPDPNDQVDGDDNGSLVTGLGVATGTITLVSNQQPVVDDADPNLNTTIDFAFVPVADLAVTKTVNGAESDDFAGGTAVFDVTVTNNGPNDATGVQVVDTLPAGLTFDSIQNASGVFTPSVNGSTVTVDIGDLNNGLTATFQLVATIGDNATGQITNAATVTTANQVDPVESDNDNDAVLELVTTDLRITQIDQTDPLNAGEQQVYTLTVFNDGPNDATGVVVTDTLPTGVTFLSGDVEGNPAAVGYDVGTNTVTATVGALANGATAEITLTVELASDFEGPLTNTASVAAVPNTDPDPSNNTTDEETAVNRVVDLAIGKIAVGDAVAGGTFSYTVEVTNSGPGDARGVTVSDTLVSELAFVSLDAGTSGATVTENGQELTFDLGTLPAGQTASFSFDVSLASSAGETVNNAVTVATADTDSDATNDLDDVTVNVQREVDLMIEKSVDLTTAVPGADQLVYTITVSHAAGSLSDAIDVVVTDVLPAGLSGQLIDAPTADATDFDSATRTATVSFGALSVGESRSFTITADIAAELTGELANPASVVSSVTDENPADNDDDATTTLTPEFDVAVTKLVDDETPGPGATVTYGIEVTNSGPSVATGVSVTDVVPDGLTFDTATLDGETGTLDAGTIEFAAVTLAPGETLTGTLAFTVDNDADGQITNTITVTADPGDTDNTNDAASDEIDVIPVADLALTKSADVTENAQPGSELVYTITVSNEGPSPAAGVEVVDTLPSGVSFVSGSGPNDEALSASGGQVTVDGGTLGDGESFSFTITVEVNGGATGSLENSAAVSSDTSDPDNSNDSASVTTTIDGATASISGFVYVDANANGTRDSGEAGISGVLITLTGVDLLGNAVDRVTNTDSDGLYGFDNLPGGTYEVSETQPAGFRNGQEEAGTGATAVVNDDVFTELGLDPDAEAVDFNFGELIEPLSKRRFLASAQAN